MTRIKVLVLLAVGLLATPASASLSEIVSHIYDTSLTETERIDAAREFVFTNSIHGEGAPYAWNTPVVLDMLWDQYNNMGPEPIIACGPRVLALESILSGLNVSNRIITVFTDAGTTYASHTFVEAFNRDTGKWEVQDPDFGIYYVGPGGRRMSTQDLMFIDLSQVVPTSPRYAGWAENNVDHLRRDPGYFELAIYFSKWSEATQWFHIIVNTTRFDLDRVFPDTGLTMRQYIDERYPGSQVLEFLGHCKTASR